MSGAISWEEIAFPMQGAAALLIYFRRSSFMERLTIEDGGQLALVLEVLTVMELGRELA